MDIHLNWTQNILCAWVKYSPITDNLWQNFLKKLGLENMESKGLNTNMVQFSFSSDSENLALSLKF